MYGMYLDEIHRRTKKRIVRYMPFFSYMLKYAQFCHNRGEKMLFTCGFDPGVVSRIMSYQQTLQ
jgi:saccharopine dehydrogenase-like NADP-dependent oxidoreductase